MKKPPDLFRTHHEPPPQRLDLGVGVMAGFITALAVRHSLGVVSTWVDIVGAAFLGFFASYWIRREVMLPKTMAELDTAEASELARSIQEAAHASYAVSSDWIDLWRSDAFTYYLSLDQVASLAIYTRKQQSPLRGLTDSEVERRKFVGYCRTLMKEVADGKPPPGEHRMRILIYPRAVYESYKDRFVSLLRLHSAGRIPCIPLISEELENDLSVGERRAIEHLTTATLGQSLFNKIPPQPLRVHYQLRNSDQENSNGAMTFPDLLLIDPVDIDRGQLWWYSKGSVRNLGAKDHKTDIDTAYSVFRILCAKGANAVWANFGSDNIGNVPITMDTGRDANELFFALTYYQEWLSWIETNSHRHPAAAALFAWISEESKLLEAFGKHSSDSSGKVHVLDVGCGFGRHLIHLASVIPQLTGLGIDIVSSMVAQASHDARVGGLDSRLYFCEDDATSLETCHDGEFDAAICMTNTLGNLDKGKATEAIMQIHRTLRPGGQLLLSVYSAQSVTPRLDSYREVKLHVRETGKSVQAAEGLQSSYFLDQDIRELLTNEIFEVMRLSPLAGIGWAVQARKR